MIHRLPIPKSRPSTKERGRHPSHGLPAPSTQRRRRESYLAGGPKIRSSVQSSVRCPWGECHVWVPRQRYLRSLVLRQHLAKLSQVTGTPHHAQTPVRLSLTTITIADLVCLFSKLDKRPTDRVRNARP